MGFQRDGSIILDVVGPRREGAPFRRFHRMHFRKWSPLYFIATTDNFLEVLPSLVGYNGVTFTRLPSFEYSVLCLDL